MHTHAHTLRTATTLHAIATLSTTQPLTAAAAAATTTAEAEAESEATETDFRSSVLSFVRSASSMCDRPTNKVSVNVLATFRRPSVETEGRGRHRGRRQPFTFASLENESLSIFVSVSFFCLSLSETFYPRYQLA